MKPFVTSPNLLSSLKLSKAERLFAKRYLLAECLGSGSTGTVYSAFDVQTRKLVAVKHLKRFAHEEELFRFKQSFRAALSLRHPHLVEAYEYVLTGEVPYLTMELVQGERLPAGSPMPEHLAVDVAGQVLLALDYMHARGLLHRDLKPDNLRFTTQGTLKLLDLATLEPIGGTPAGQISGTLAYMAPEVFQGRTLSATADLYSVGVLLYQLLCGSLPFRAQHTHELIDAHLNVAPRELGALRPDLSPQLTDLVMRLLAKDPSARPQRASDALRELAPRVSAPIAQEAERQGYSYLLATGLVGRQAELNALLAALKQAADGHGTGVFIGAQPGVGKSRLIQELKLHCQQEHVAFLAASCIDEGLGAYGPMRQLLQAVLPFASEAQPAELERLLAWLGPGRARAMAKSDLHQAIAALLAAIARRQPLVLCVDDLQWADTLSLELLTHCLDEHRDAPILWLGAYRQGEIGQHHAVLQAIEENLAEGLVLEAFDATECATLVRGVLGQDAPTGLMPLIAETTQGNCFFVIEMLRYLVDQGHLRYAIGTWHLSIPDGGVGMPTSIQDLVCHRLHGLSRSALALAQLGAVYADTLRPASLRRLSALEEQALLDAINELIERQVWQRSGGGFRFVHERIREALYQELPSETRQALHQQITERLAGLKVSAATLAYHRYRGPDPLAAVPDLCRAGAEAETLGALHEAFRHWKLAADLLETQDEHDPRLLDLWLDIGIKCGFSVDSRAGEEALEKALARLEAIGNPWRAARLIAATTTLVRRLPRWIARPILHGLTRAQAFRPPRPHLPPNYLALVPLLIEAYTWLAFCCNSNGKLAKASTVNRKAEALALDHACWSWGLVMTARAYAHLLEGRFDESVAVAREAFALLRDEKRLQAIELSCGALVFANNQVYQGEPPREDLLDELRNRADAHQMTEWQGMGQYPRMVHAALTGRAKEGLAAIAEAQPFSRRCGRGTVLEREIRLAQARLHVVLGQFEQALEVIEGGIALDGVVEMPYFTSRFFEIRGRACLALGELDAAWGAFAEVIAREEAYGLKFTLPEAYLGLSEVECRHGDLVSAQAFIERAQEILDVPAYRCAIKRIGLLHQMGRVAMAAGRLREAANHLEAARAIARVQDNPALSAQVLLDLGRALQAAGEAGAEACWQEAQRLHEACENAYGIGQVRALLEAGRPMPPETDDGETLLRQCTEALVASRSEEAVLECLLEHAQRAIAADRGAIVACTASGLLTIAGGERGAIRWGSGPEVDAAQVQRALALGAVQISPEPGLRVMLPLDTTLALCVERDAASGRLEPELPWLLRALAAVGRVALHNARSLAEEHRRAARLRILNEMSLVVSSSRDTEQILDHLLMQVLKLTGVEQALLVVARGEAFELLGARTAEAYEGPPSFSRSVVERVIHDQAALCVLDTESVISPSQSVFALGLKSVMAVPLAIAPQLPGALYVSSRVSAQAFNELDLELLRAIAAWAAIAYQHAQQARWLERHASENELALAIQQAEQHHLLEERRALDQELALARSIQQGFFPAPSRQASLDVHGACHAAREVGGDFYDVIPLPGHRTAIAIGDVSGKGVSAALYMAVARTTMRMALPNAGSPRECLIELNTRLLEDLRDDNFITCFLGIYDEQTRHFAYASAGHQLAYHIGGGVRPLTGRGVPLGMDPEVFDASLTDQALTLAPGDRIALVTDGVLEALDPELLEFGEERLLNALAADGASAEEGVNQVLARVREHVAGAPAWDDMTVLVARAACSAEITPPSSPLARA